MSLPNIISYRDTWPPSSNNIKGVEETISHIYKTHIGPPQGKGESWKCPKQNERLENIICDKFCNLFRSPHLEDMRQKGGKSRPSKISKGCSFQIVLPIFANVANFTKAQKTFIPESRKYLWEGCLLSLIFNEIILQFRF